MIGRTLPCVLRLSNELRMKGKKKKKNRKILCLDKNPKTKKFVGFQGYIFKPGSLEAN